MHWKDALRRAVRTFIQAFIGTLLSLWTALTLSPGTLPDIELAKRILIACVVAGVIAVCSWLMNVLEDNGAVPAILKPPTRPIRPIRPT